MTKIKINKDGAKNAFIIATIAMSLGFALGIHYQSNQTKTVNEQVQAQLTAIKK
jgi:hypothetical protein